MKTKKIEQKLSLNKNTICHLDNQTMSSMKGGIEERETYIYETCCTCSWCMPTFSCDTENPW